MNDLERYNRDKASVMSMLKFILAVGITVGLLYVGKIVAVILIPFLIGFGGLSVHCQTAAALAGTGVRLKKHFWARMLHGMLAAMMMLAVG